MTENAGPKQGGRTRKGQRGVPDSKPLPDPSERDRLEGRESARRVLDRRRGIQISPDFGPSHNHRSLWMSQFVDAFGTSSPAFANRMLNQLANGMRREGQTDDHGVNAGLAVVVGLKPENEIEAMLAVQMAATHDVDLRRFSGERFGWRCAARTGRG